MARKLLALALVALFLLAAVGCHPTQGGTDPTGTTAVDKEQETTSVEETSEEVTSEEATTDFSGESQDWPDYEEQPTGVFATQPRTSRAVNIQTTTGSASAKYHAAYFLNNKTVGEKVKSPITGETYTLFFMDDFNGTDLDHSVWTKYDTNDPNFNRYQIEELQANKKENVKVENGKLNIYAKKETTTEIIQEEGYTDEVTKYYTAGRVNTQGKKQYKYGRFEMYAKLPTGKGMWPSFRTMGTLNTWPKAGEISIMEMFDAGAKGRNTSYTTAIHWAETNATDPTNLEHQKNVAGIFDVNTYKNGAQLGDEYHLYGMEWTEKKVYFYFDGTLIGDVDVDADADLTKVLALHNSHYWDLNFAIAGGEYAPDASTVFPQVYSVDWVKVWHVQQAPSWPNNYNPLGK